MPAGPTTSTAIVDPATVFIAAKSHDGRTLKALERPGLWNGAMAGWNTVFVEVPDTTFAPVKSVLDLLRPDTDPEHNSADADSPLRVAMLRGKEVIHVFEFGFVRPAHRRAESTPARQCRGLLSG